MKQTDKQSASVSSKRATISSSIFLFLISIPVLLTVAILFIGQKDISTEENRVLTQFPSVSADSIISGDFQDRLEHALIDQWPLSEIIKSTVLNNNNRLLHLQQHLLYLTAPKLQTSYQVITEGYYHYNGDNHRIVEQPTEHDPFALEALSENLNTANGVRRFVYFIENSRTTNFDQPNGNNSFYQQVIQTIKPDDAALFAVPDYETYQEYFYQTDHHWNYKGSYEGYRAIYLLLHGTEAGIIEPGQVITTNVVFQGSYARQTHELCADEMFSFMHFDLPEYATFINGRKKAYGNQKMYENGKIPNESLTNHYANCYGGDYSEILYDFGTTDRGNLIISHSGCCLDSNKFSCRNLIIKCR